LVKNAPIPKQLILKVGALVMIRQNDPQGRWFNGSLGHLTAMGQGLLKIRLLDGEYAEIEKVCFSSLDAEGKEIASATNFPVNLAYATTIHKAQGMTLDQVKVDLGALWEPGQAYVALSRAKSSTGLYLTRWSAQSIKSDPAVTEFNRRVWGF
jgi:ATP-dependent DNA helicase PIF1